MTTFQDLPPQSRRASRANGRADGFEVDATVRPPSARTGRRAQLPSATEWQKDEAELAAEREQAAAEQHVVTYGGPGPDSDLTSAPETAVDDLVVPAPVPGRRVSLPTGELHPFTHAISTDEVAAGLEAVDVADAAPADEPTDHRTIVDEDTVAYVPTDEDLIDAAPASDAHDATEVDVDPTPDDLGPDPVGTPVAAVTESVHNAPENSAAAASTSDAPVATPGRPLTRREIREARVAAERAAGLEEVPEAIVSILNSGPIILPYLNSPATTATPIVSAHEQSALAEFDELTSVHDGDAVPVGDNEHVSAPASTWDIPLEPTSAAADDEDNEGVDDPVGGKTPLGITVPAFIETSQTPASARGAGHWSVSDDNDDDITSLENTITRLVNVGGALTTNALVLPSIPQSSDLTTPYTATGDTMLTGSIDLPRSLGSTGVHPSQVDNSDFELDPLDREVPSTDSAPVRAIRAVSTHTGSNGLIATKKPQGNHMLTVLVISSSGLAVVVVGLLVAGISSGLFQ
jgi:hypothetical protein